jgi:hypothetical protein
MLDDAAIIALALQAFEIYLSVSAKAVTTYIRSRLVTYHDIGLRKTGFLIGITSRDIHAISEDVFGTESFPTVRPATVDKFPFVSCLTGESEDEVWMRLQAVLAKKGQKRINSSYEKLVKDLRG